MNIVMRQKIKGCFLLPAIFGTSVRHSSWSAFGRPPGNDVSGHYKHHYLFFFHFPFFFSVATFSHRRSARIKKLIQRKLLRMPKNLGVDTFPDPVAHFGAPWQPYWILQVVRRCRWCSVAGCDRVPPARLC